MIVSQDQNFTKIAAEWDTGTYTCTAGIGKVVKKSNMVHITVCGEYPRAHEVEWEKGTDH